MSRQSQLWSQFLLRRDCELNENAEFYFEEIAIYLGNTKHTDNYLMVIKNPKDNNMRNIQAQSPVGSTVKLRWLPWKGTMSDVYSVEKDVTRLRSVKV